MTTPGVPMVFAGDEIGLGGDWGEDARRTMPWSRPETWDTALFDGYRELIALRRGSRRSRAAGSATRTSPRTRSRTCARRAASTVLCLAARGAHDPVRLPLGATRRRASSRRSCGEDVSHRRRSTPSSRPAGRRSMPGESCDDEGGPTWLKCSSKKSTRSTREASTPSRTSRSTSQTASSSSSSARRAAARRPRSA